VNLRYVERYVVTQIIVLQAPASNTVHTKGHQDFTLILSQQHEITMSLCDWTGKGSLVSSSLTSIDNDNIPSKATPISANDAPPTTGENK